MARVANLEGRLLTIDPWRVAVALAASTAVVVFLGGLEYLEAAPEALDLDDEFTVPAFYSSGLLLAASALAAALAARARRAGERPVSLWVLAGVFAFMGVDEVAVIHENFDDWFGLDNYFVGLLPIMALAAIAWLSVLRRLPDGVARLLWVAGAAAWIVSAGLEIPTQERVEVEYYGLLMVPEEFLEMVGSCCFGLTLLLAMRPEGAAAFPRPARRR